MAEPKRVQMTRNKPWRVEHPDAVIVDRRTEWGNPAILKRFKYGTLVSFPAVIHASGKVVRLADKGSMANYLDHGEAAGAAVRWFREHVAPHLDLEWLAGRDLACWCKPGDPCHADVLLELANPPALVDRDGTNTEQDTTTT